MTFDWAYLFGLFSEAAFWHATLVVIKLREGLRNPFAVDIIPSEWIFLSFFDKNSHFQSILIHFSG